MLNAITISQLFFTTFYYLSHDPNPKVVFSNTSVRVRPSIGRLNLQARLFSSKKGKKLKVMYLMSEVCGEGYFNISEKMKLVSFWTTDDRHF